MNARDEILSRIRSAQAGGAVEVSPAPASDVLDHHAMIELFVQNLIDYRAVVSRCGSGEVAETVVRVLAGHGARRVVPAPGLPDDWRPAGFELVTDDALSARDLDAVDAVVTASAVSIAQTGTIVLDHQPDQGRRALSLVPDVHVCVVRAEQVVTSVPEGITMLQASVRAGRPLTWISGPSATSDIELDRVEGVHGPRNLEVVLVE
ncbi:LutC/YkgG family protein [Calidifontibacter terrae]